MFFENNPCPGKERDRQKYLLPLHNFFLPAIEPTMYEIMIPVVKFSKLRYKGKDVIKKTIWRYYE